MMKKISISILFLIFAASVVSAGGLDSSMGPEKTTVTGELVCIGCTLQELYGAKTRGHLFAHDAIGFKTTDGKLWSIMNNEKGHDVIRAHKVVTNKKATISGWFYSQAQIIEIDEIDVNGVYPYEIRKAAKEVDQLIAVALTQGVRPARHKYCNINTGQEVEAETSTLNLDNP